jgi:hypothetical protein
VPPVVELVTVWADSGVVFVHLGPLLWCDIWNRWVLEDSAVEELHDIEVSANDLLILTKAECFWHWDVCLLEGVDDPVFTINLMRCLESH